MVQTVAGSAVDITKAIVGDKAESDRSAAQIRTAALEQFGSEFEHQEPKRHWFDRIIDGLNRLPRPIFAFGTIGLIITSMYDPIWFTARMVALSQVPEPLWWILGAIITFFFGARETEKFRGFRTKSPSEVRQVVHTIKEIEDIADDESKEPRKATMSDEEFEDAMNSDDPLSNEAIMEWNRRNQDADRG